jgi:two-component system, NarL family, response regulator NreC
MNASNPIGIVLVEDHTIVREGLRALLSAREEFRVVGEVGNGREALALIKQKKPRVVVMDLNLPGLNGVDVIASLKQSLPEIKVLVLSMHATEEFVRPAVRAGADGFLVKGAGLSDLVAAIVALSKGEAFFSPCVAKILLEGLQPGSNSSSESLTLREREVLRLVARGKSSREIADLLGISVKTVEGHRGNIMEKLHIHELAGLVRYAIRMGLVSPQE